MKEHPILFSSDQVRALLSGNKTQTRRVVKPQPLFKTGVGWLWDRKGRGMEKPEGAVLDPPYGFSQPHWLSFCPYGAVGDRLWVRETWAYYGGDEYMYQRIPENAMYAATWATDPRNTPCLSEPRGDRHWRPSIHMPRWASRLTLEITEVRVQRLQEISEGDAEAEGWQRNDALSTDPEVHRDAARDWFMDLWDSINAKRGHGWDANPWVWAITFRVLPSSVSPSPRGDQGAEGRQ